ncbi:hypothetical protein CapIbe_018653 [Capra ibex]
MASRRPFAMGVDQPLCPQQVARVSFTVNQMMALPALKSCMAPCLPESNSGFNFRQVYSLPKASPCACMLEGFLLAAEHILLMCLGIWKYQGI